jgi:hypothetical protein
MNYPSLVWRPLETEYLILSLGKRLRSAPYCAMPSYCERDDIINNMIHTTSVGILVSFYTFDLTTSSPLLGRVDPYFYYLFSFLFYLLHQ